MSDEEAKTGPTSSGEPGAVHPALPYLAMLGLAAVLALALGAYLWLHRAEILRILTQSPT